MYICTSFVLRCIFSLKLNCTKSNECHLSECVSVCIWFILIIFSQWNESRNTKRVLKHRDSIYGITVTWLCMLLVKLFLIIRIFISSFLNSKSDVLINLIILVLSSSMAVLLPNVSLKQLLREKKEFSALWPAIRNCSLLSGSVESLSVFLYKENFEHLP